MGRDWARALVKRTSGALATIYSCPACSYAKGFKKGVRSPGRGYGLAMGGALSSMVGAHIRREHPNLTPTTTEEKES